MQGTYLVGYIETNDEKILKSVNTIKDAVLRVCKTIELNIVGEKYHMFKGSNGITYCFILSQSHFVVHTWPEYNKIFFDIFTCNKKLNEEQCVYTLSKEFKGKVKEISKIEYK